MKKDDKTKALILEQLRKTPILQIASEKIGIARMTLHRWRLDDSDFNKAVEEALSEGCILINDLAESQLINAIKDRNLQAVTYWLRFHHPTYKQSAFQSGFAVAQDDDQNIIFELFGQLRPETMKLIAPPLEDSTEQHDETKPAE